MSVELATAYVSIVPSAKGFADKVRGELGGDVDRVARDAGESSGRGFVSKFTTGFGGIATALAGIGAGMVAVNFLGDSVTAASDLGESLNAVGKIFGDSQQQIIDWGKTNANSFGLSQRAFNEMATPLGALLKNSGMEMDAVAGNTIDLTKRAADLASVFNVDVDQALQAINSGLKGEADPLEAFGIGLSAAAVEAKMASMATQGLTFATEEEAKMQARLALIMEQSSAVAGDFTSTADGLANSQRIAAAKTEEMQAKIGEKLIPVMLQVTKIKLALVGAIASKLIPALTWLGATVGPVASSIASALGGVDWAGMFSKAADAMSPIVDAVKGVLDSVLPLGAALMDLAVAAWPTIQEAASALAKVIGGALVVGFTAVEKVVDVLTPVIGFLADNFNTVRLFLVPLVAGFTAYKAIMLAVAIQQKAVAITTGLVSAAQGILNTVMAANPIMLVVIAIAALVAGLVYAYTHSERFRAIVDAIGSAIATGFKAAVDWLVNTAWPAISGFFVAIGEGIQGVVRFFAEFPENVIAALGDVGSWLVDSGKAIIGGLIDGVMALFNVWKAIYIDMPLQVLGWLGDAASWLVGKGRDIISGLLSGVVNGAQALWTWWVNLNATVREKIGDAASFLVDKGRDIVNGLINGIKEVAGWALGQAINFQLTIINAIGDAASWLYEAGKDVVRGLINGIADMAGELAGAVSGIAGTVKDGLAGALRIGSPSKVMEELGGFTMDGFIAGLAGEQGALKRQLRTLTDEVSGTAFGVPRATVAAAYAPGPGTGSGGDIHVNVLNPAPRPRDIGDAVAWTLKTSGRG